MIYLLPPFASTQFDSLTMIIFNNTNQDTDLLARHYENGLPYDMGVYLQDTQSMGLMLFEEDAEEAVKNGRLVCTGEQLKPAKRKLMDWASTQISGPMDYLEFGVYKGGTIKEMAARYTHPDSRFYGFDTFEGLPDAWVSTWGNHHLKMDRDKGTLNSNGMPVITDERVFLYKGVFQETLPAFLREVFHASRDASRPLFINIDSDIYSAALYVLTSLHPYLRDNDHVYFDEFFDSINEYAAFNDYIRSYYARDNFRPVARAYDSFLFRVEGLSHKATNTLVEANLGKKSRASALSAIKALILGR